MASSSAGDKLGSAAAGSSSEMAIVEAATGKKETVDYIEMPLAGHLSLDALPGNRWQITHNITRERMVATCDSAEMVESDETGDAALIVVIGEAEPKVFALADQLKVALFQRQDTDEIFVHTGGPLVRLLPLETWWSRYRRARIFIQLTSSNAKIDISIYIFRVARAPRQKLYWSMNSLYNAPGMKSLQGVPSKWAWNFAKRWAPYFEKYLNKNQFVYGSYISGDSVAKLALPPHERCVSTQSLSTVGVLFCLPMWCFMQAQKGGIADEHVRLHCKQFFGRLIGAVTSQLDEPMEMSIIMDADWAPTWPRPPALVAALGAMKVFLRPNGCLDFSAMKSGYEDAPRAQPLKSWYFELAPYLGDEGTIQLLPFVKITCAKLPLRPLYLQVLLELAIAVERSINMLSADEVPYNKPMDGISMDVIALEDFSDPLVRDHRLLEYVEASRFASKGVENFFLATDKGNSGSLPLQFSFLSLPDNLGVALCPQVDKLYDEDQAKAPGLLPSQASAASSSDQTSRRLGRDDRHRAWVTRYTGGTKPGSWRPVPIYRKGARKWLEMTDNQLKVHIVSSPAGWAMFVPDEKLQCWRRWQDWPWVGVARDLGSDGLAASMALLYKYKASVTFYDDFSHGANCDLKVCLRAAGLFQMWLLMFCSWNLPYGTDNDESRRLQVRQCMAATYKNETAETCVLFKAYAVQLLEEFRRSGKELPGVKAPEEELWDFLAERSAFSTPSYRKASMCRFADIVTSAELNYNNWYLDLWERTTAALDSDCLKGGKFNERIVYRAVELQEEVGEHSGSTAPKKPRIDDRTLKSVAQNALALSVMMLGEEQNRRIVGAFLCAALPVKKWHQHQNHFLRECEKSKQFLTEQIGEYKYQQHVNDIVSQLGVESCLEEQGFVVGPALIAASGNGDAVDEDYYADMFGQIVLHLASARMRRGLWLTEGWPMKMTRVLVGGETANTTLDEFRHDCDMYRRLKEGRGSSAKQKAVVKRHCLQWTANEQIRLATLEPDGEVMTGLQALMSARSLGVISSQVVEDMVGAAKNDPNTKQAKKFRKPETAMANIISKSVVDMKHKYKALEADAHAPEATARLTSDCFHNTGKPSLPFADVQSTSSSCAWYSPSATNCNTPYADLRIISDAHNRGNFGLVASAGAGMVCDAQHRLAFVIRPNGVRQAGEVWYVALWHWPDSAALVWLAVRKVAPGSADFYLELSLNEKGPKLLSIFDYKDMVCCEIKWKSYLSQFQAYPEWRESCPVSIKPFLGKELGMMQLAASKCFWNMSKSEVVTMCKYGGVALPDGGTLYEVLSRAVSSVLGTSEGGTLKVMQLRLTDSELCNEYGEAILEVGGAVEVLEVTDRDTIGEEKKQATNRIEARRQYQAEYSDNMTTFRLAQESKRKKQKRGNMTKGTLTTKLTQKEAAKFIPPDTSIWRGCVNGSWQGECKPFARLFESWRKTSEEEAMRRIIRNLWRQYLLLHSLPKEECPWEDVRAEL